MAAVAWSALITASGCDDGGADGDLYIVDRASAVVAGTGGTAGAPKVIYLAYADGNVPPAVAPDPCKATAPKFVCQFAPTLKECQRQVQAYLDDWYADFNVVFTLNKPTSGTYYTEIVSSGGGAWCGAQKTTAGIAPFYCQDLAGGTAYTFMGGASAKETAIIIAQEQAHLVGLEHTQSQRDLMNPTVCTACEGFENVANPVDTDHCGRPTQNSYQMLKDRLGAWPGGVKPSPFGCDPDVSPPSIAIVQPADGATVGSSFQVTAQATDDCEVKQVSVRIEPLGLGTQSASPPFTWNLTRIAGRQTITVTAADTSGKQSSASITINAPGASSGSGGATAGGTGGSGAHLDGGSETAQSGDGATPAESPGAAATGCQVAGCATSGRADGGDGSPGAGLGLAIGAALLIRRRRRR
ncbi:MAG TPA: Ig-like domain-containing protein [Polyangia bacterium]